MSSLAARKRVLEAQGGDAATFVGSSLAQASGATTSLIIGKPAGVVNGDLLVMVVCASYVPSSVHTFAPSGWTVANTRTSGALGIYVAYKLAGGAEPSSYTVSLTNGYYSGAIAAYRGSTQVAVVGALILSGNTDTAVASGITMPAPGVLLGAYANGSTTTTSSTAPPDMVKRGELYGEGGTSPGAIVLTDVLQQPAGASGDKTLTWTSGIGKGPLQLLVGLT